MTDILSQTLNDLPENSCLGLKKAALGLGNLEIETAKCFNEITLSITTTPSISYVTLDYPSPYSGNSTFLTGIRAIPNSNEVYISGFSTASGQQDIAFIYKGPVLGGGTWHKFSYPSSLGVTVSGTYIYGPNYDDITGNLEAVGNYNTVEAGLSNLGFLYQGPLDGSGSWLTLNPQELANSTISGVIVHSTMGGLAVGNYNSIEHPLGTAFLYNIEENLYKKINIEALTTSVTSYGIWYNGDTNYTITGGVTFLEDHGYTIDLDSSSNKVSNYRIFSYDNQLTTSRYSHFDGITASSLNGVYNLCGDWIEEEESGAFFAISSKDSGLISNAFWVDIVYPNSTTTSANTVYENNILGVYLDGEGISHGYVVTLTFDEL